MDENFLWKHPSFLPWPTKYTTWKIWNCFKNINRNKKFRSIILFWYFSNLQTKQFGIPSSLLLISWSTKAVRAPQNDTQIKENRYIFLKLWFRWNFSFINLSFISSNNVNCKSYALCQLRVFLKLIFWVIYFVGQ